MKKKPDEAKYFNKEYMKDVIKHQTDSFENIKSTYFNFIS